MDFLQPNSFFDLDEFEHRELFSGCRYAWEALTKISEFLDSHPGGNVHSIGVFGRPLPETIALWRGEIFKEGLEILGGDVTKQKFRVRIHGEEAVDAVILFAGSVLWDDRIYLGGGSVLEPGALIKGPTVIGSYTEVRQGAYIRGKCVIGDRCVVGHTTEMKSSIMLNDAKAGHFAYVGDSILGCSSNLGAGTKLANLKMDGELIRLQISGTSVDTGMRKLGAILGDRVEMGCNSVTNPGTLLGRDCRVYPVTSVKPGYYGPSTIVR